jgi:hypothetical protein
VLSFVLLEDILIFDEQDIHLSLILLGTLYVGFGRKDVFVDKKKITSSSQLPYIYYCEYIYHHVMGMNKNCFLCMERVGMTM